MAGLLDIAPSVASETLAIAGKKIEVRGISSTQLAKLMRRFPEFGKFFAGVNGVNPDTLSPETAEKAGVPYNADAAMEVGLMLTEAMPAIIAAGCGYPGDAAQERAAEYLYEEDKIAMFTAIMRLTNPKAPKSPLAKKPDAGDDTPQNSAGESTQAAS